jgi:hypothetical protein
MGCATDIVTFLLLSEFESRSNLLDAGQSRMGGALKLADHRAQFEFEQFENFPRRIAFGALAEQATVAGAAACAATIGAAGSGGRFRKKPNAMGPLGNL